MLLRWHGIALSRLLANITATASSDAGTSMNCICLTELASVQDMKRTDRTPDGQDVHGYTRCFCRRNGLSK